MKHFRIFLLGLFALGIISVYVYSCLHMESTPDTPIISDTPSTDTVPVYTYKVINTYPHDPHAFTQGLVFKDGFLYEGTGLRGQSTLRKVELETGSILQIYELPQKYFGEGITIYEDKIIQITWKSRVGFVYDEQTFALLQEFTYPTEGWGITHDGSQLIMSDGSATLYFWDPETFEEIGQIHVSDSGEPVTMLNELEYIKGEIYANVWQTDYIAQISPQTGEVLGWIDLEGLLTLEDYQQIDVLNGIAYDIENDRLFVTGKWWPTLFEIELIPKNSSENALNLGSNDGIFNLSQWISLFIQGLPLFSLLFLPLMVRKSLRLFTSGTHGIRLSKE